MAISIAGTMVPTQRPVRTAVELRPAEDRAVICHSMKPSRRPIVDVRQVSVGVKS